MSENVIDLNKEKIIRAVESQTDLTRENSNLEEAFDECIQRNNIYHQLEDSKANLLIAEEKEPYPCCNMVCPEYRQTEFNHHNEKTGEITFSGRTDYCKDSRSHGCLFQTNDHPPNSLNYEEYMPSHVEALDMLEKHGLFKGDRQRYEEANSQYNKASSREERNNTEIKGIYFWQVGQIIENLVKEIPDFFNPKSDMTALSQCLSVEIEKAMGIYPNIKIK